jgi:hypothetical protein
VRLVASLWRMPVVALGRTRRHAWRALCARCDSWSDRIRACIASAGLGRMIVQLYQPGHAGLQGEASTLEAFRRDVYACHGELKDKKVQRDPFSMGIPTPAQCPALTPFMSRTCLRKMYTGELPWREARFRRASGAMHAPQT